MKLSPKTGAFLILGAGQIGKAAAVKLFSRAEVRDVIVHTLTEKEAKDALTFLEHHRPRGIKVHASWGDILGPQISEKVHEAETDLRSEIFDYYYQPFTAQTAYGSSLYQTIKKWRPEYIIDAINTATVFGYEGKLYEVERALWKETILDEEPAQRRNLTQELLMAAFVPKMTRFVQVLECALLDFGVERYVKVSTTGLGGMGFNIPYTHGDPSEPGISTRLLGKIAAAGVLNQLLWNLSHTPGVNIRIVIPATLVGWEPVRSHEIRQRKNGAKEVIRLIEDAHEQTLAPNTPLSAGAKETKKPLTILSLGSGENEPYSLAEAASITANHQMGSVTKEEVAEAAVETLLGEDRHNVFAAMDQVVLGPSFAGAETRRTILELLETMEREETIPSIATGNLGPRVAKHLFELFLIIKATPNLKWDNPGKIHTDVHAYLGKHPKVRNFILSLGLPIITNDNKAWIGAMWRIPPKYDDLTITKEKIEHWAKLGWVDVRKATVTHWIRKIKALPPDQYGSAIAYKNLSRQTGELLAAIYSLEGLGRK